MKNIIFIFISIGIIGLCSCKSTPKKDWSDIYNKQIDSCKNPEYLKKSIASMRTTELNNFTKWKEKNPKANDIMVKAEKRGYKLTRDECEKFSKGYQYFIGMSKDALKYKLGIPDISNTSEVEGVYEVVYFYSEINRSFYLRLKDGKLIVVSYN